MGRLRHLVTFAFIRMVEISRVQIQDEYTYVYVFIRIKCDLYIYKETFTSLIYRQRECIHVQ